MSSYPDTDEFEPTVQLAEEPEDEPDLATSRPTDDFEPRTRGRSRDRREYDPVDADAVSTRREPRPA